MAQRFILSILVPAILIIASGCTDPKQVPELTRKLRSSSSSERSKAALALGRIGAPHAKSAVPELISLLDDDNTGVQSGAAYALRKIGGSQAEAALAAHSGR